MTATTGIGYLRTHKDFQRLDAALKGRLKGRSCLTGMVDPHRSGFKVWVEADQPDEAERASQVVVETAKQLGIEIVA